MAQPIPGKTVTEIEAAGHSAEVTRIKARIARMEKAAAAPESAEGMIEAARLAKLKEIFAPAALLKYEWPKDWRTVAHQVDLYFKDLPRDQFGHITEGIESLFSDRRIPAAHLRKPGRDDQEPNPLNWNVEADMYPTIRLHSDMHREMVQAKTGEDTRRYNLKVNINSSTIADIQTALGIGPVQGQAVG